MEITQQVREYAAEHGYKVEQAVEQGMSEMSKEFDKQGKQIYS
jgi:phosphomethylpyrimidine synthase